MSRRARLTILELGASSTAWSACTGLGTDDWVVVAQQRDETSREFAARVRQRARKLRKSSSIESIDLYAAPHPDASGQRARRLTIVELGSRVAAGGRLTVWSGANDASDDEVAAILAQYGPLLAKRQIATNHQTVDAEERSGVRHAIPTRPETEVDDESAFDFEISG